MTDQPNPADPATRPTPSPPGPLFEQRLEERMERFGKEAEEAGHRLAANPVVRDATDTAARVWGLIVLAVGLWFLAEFTLGIDMPAIPWRDIWPLGLVIIGLAVVVRGLRRGDA
ncbi:MAG TPA: hypothetical protein VNL94_07475 [Candidatus Binatia bacterium]|nr:hypothetical protein [Candidatus Binatia bacterium]